MLAISKDSFHYKYYKILRQAWGFQDYGDCRTSLCLYSQFLFWFSILTFIVSPILFVSWSFIKFLRFFYKVCSWTATGRAIEDFLDEFGLGDVIDKNSTEMVERPILTLLTIFFKTTLCLLAIFGVVGFLIWGVVCIKILLSNILGFLLAICLGIFYIYCVLGWVILNVAIWLKMLGLVVTSFIVTYLVAIVSILAFVALSSLISYVIIKIISSSEKIKTFLGFKVNGYQKAREDNTKRREVLKEQREKELEENRKKREELREKKEKGEIPYTLLEKTIMFLWKSTCFIFSTLYNFFVARTKNVKGGSYRVMTGFGVIYETIKGIKQGVCPIVEFVDENDEEGTKE